ncbi:hypothetical protein O3G_MSEX008300 [Manduca sexta]|uniref:Uncharacterized protein n=2 Tax=Manduca sexta TaxID=7130 RepID=A0A922CQ52_MANSE|nr:hypothetical protein O3G_MSEX008300 [Manduca sexta]
MSRQVDVKALVSHIVRGDGADKCRICMGDTAEGQVFLGDTVMMDGDKAVTLAELLELITGVEVAEDDDLPNGLCRTCSASAFKAAEFRTFCREASKRWTTTLDMLNMIPNNNSKNIYALILGNKISIYDSKMFKEPQDKTKETCPKVKTVKHKNYAKSLHCQCSTCGRRFTYAHELHVHLKESMDLIQACYVCAKIMSREDLLKHLVQKHNKKPLPCKKCSSILTSSLQYKQHMVKEHGPGVCTCGDCGRTFQSTQAYHAHLSIHAPKNCPRCSKLFRNKKCYVHHVKKCCDLHKNRKEVHQTKHKLSILVKNKDRHIKVGLRGSADKECICDYCKKRFAGKKFVAAHIQIVHLKNTHRPCAYCGKLLAAAHMSSHMKKHQPSQSYKCGHCGIVLKTKLGYSQHLRLHTGERPYTCQYCGETFTASSRKSEHIRKTHKSTEEVLRHACQLCPARFRLPYRLKKHILTVHSKTKPPLYECNNCEVKFASCRALLAHSRICQI